MALFVVFKSFMSCCIRKHQLTFSLFHWAVWMSRASVHNVSVLCFVCLLCLQNSSSTSGWFLVSLLESVLIAMSATAETSAIPKIATTQSVFQMLSSSLIWQQLGIIPNTYTKLQWTTGDLFVRFNSVALFAKISHYPLDRFMKLSESNYRMCVYNQLTFGGHPNSRWSPQPADLREHKKGYNSASFIDIQMKLGVEVVEHLPQHML